MRLFALATIFWACLVQAAAAQSGERWLVLPVVTSNEAVVVTASDATQELAKRGIDVWALGRAASHFEAIGSASVSPLSPAAVERWTAEANAVLESLVRGAPARALDLLEEEDVLALGKVVELNRRPELARSVLDTCLLGVRALLETEGVEPGRAMARRCRQLTVLAEPTPHMHPPSVMELFAHVEAQRRSGTSALLVRSKPPACAVRVNGSIVGETPLEARHLVPGRYAVEVECEPEERGRAHFADVETGLTSVVVDARFDRAVESRPTLLLRYPDAANREAHADDDVVAIGRVVPADSLVIISTPKPDTIALELLSNPSHARLALARVKSGPSGPSRGDVALAARALIDGRCMDLTALPPAELPCEGESDAVPGAPAPDPWPANRRPRGQFIAGLALVGVGSAGLLTGYALIGPRSKAAEDWVAALDSGQGGASHQQKWYNMGIGQVIDASAGSAALVTAMPLMLPERERTPWWAWLAGGAGVGLAAFSIAYGVAADSAPGTPCTSVTTDAMDARACVKRSEQISASVLTGVTAAPLLTMPLVYLLRPARAELVPTAQVNRTGGYLAVRGSF